MIPALHAGPSVADQPHEAVSPWQEGVVERHVGDGATTPHPKTRRRRRRRSRASPPPREVIPNDDEEEAEVTRGFPQGSARGLAEMPAIAETADETKWPDHAATFKGTLGHGVQPEQAR